MFMSVLFGKVKSFVLFFVAVFRKALCCFRRRRRLSGSSEPLSHIVVSDSGNANDLEHWNDWEFSHRKPSSVQEHIEYYRQQQAKLVRQSSQEDTPSEENQNLFEDMTPRITRQTKVVVGGAGQNKGHSLDVQHDEAGFITNELQNWEENSGWEKGALDWDAQELLRANKRQERERRAWEQQQKRLEKSSRPNVLGSKIAN